MEVFSLRFPDSFSCLSAVFILVCTLELMTGATPIRDGITRPGSPSSLPKTPANTFISVSAGPTPPSSSHAPPVTASSPRLAGSATTCTPSHSMESSSGSEVTQSNVAGSPHHQTTVRVFFSDRSLSPRRLCHRWETRNLRNPGRVGGWGRET